MHPKAPSRDGRRVLMLSTGIALAFMLPRFFAFSVHAGNPKVLPSILEGFTDCPKLGLQVAGFFTVYWALHALGGWMVFWLTQPLFEHIVPRDDAKKAAVLGVVGAAFWILLANSHFYPASGFAFFNAPGWKRWSLVVGFSGLSLALSLALAGGALLRWRSVRRRYPKLTLWFGAGLAALLLAAGFLRAASQRRGVTAPRESRLQPDLILLGIDGVRVDHVGYYRSFQSSLTPAVDRLLERAAVFEHAWTVMGRTFPTWLSVLTGQYPATHGGIFNLVNPDRIHRDDTLGHQLGKADYQRVYAIDETRFSNLDAAYGFDRTVTPPMGAFDFLLDAFADTPGVNLIANTVLGRRLFPYLSMNRAFPVIYRPEVFDTTVARAIRSLDPRRPMFLAIHYELPHWPYTWAASDVYDAAGPPELEALSPEIYRKAVARVDEQVAALLRVLNAAGRLDHAVVVVFSDHGEAFNDSEPLWIWRGEGRAPIIPPRRAGHGNSVASENQNRVILGFAGFGPSADSIRPGVNLTETVSLVDIRPTLEEWLGLPVVAGRQREGVSLYRALNGLPIPERMRQAVFLETGFSPSALLDSNHDPAGLLQVGLTYYRVLANGRLVMDDRWLLQLAGQKQYAAIDGRWALAIFPNRGRAIMDGTRLLLDLETREFWDPRQPDSLPAGVPINVLRSALDATK